MSVMTVRTVLVNASAVTAIVPATRIEALRRTQSFEVPALTITDAVATDFNGLTGFAGLTSHLVQVDVYGADYTQCKELADIVSIALRAGGFARQSEIERNEPGTDPELFQKTQTWLVFT
jgi:hypothetical protein